ncbi:PqqD family protein [Polyangium aurulentum]|uniref:PqqD family protein n=1 Tax=Polyangium aurulentum TaxID=2567896 RepID=UPI00146C2118|nr:PqqD family protein [Polyangium aurulentum]UQA58794.1 PqqD family protein [Polyangium aurulentum]
MNPKASRAAVAGAQSVLSPLASFLLERADGSRSVDELRALAASAFGMEPSREATFRALDELSDHGLLEARLAPPAGRPLTRRALGFATAAAAAALLVPSLSQARLPGPQKGADKEKFAESEAKKSDKHAEKEAKKAEKHAEKEAKKAEKHAESEAKKAAESEAKKAEKAAESEAKKMKQAESEAKKHEKAAESEAKKAAESEAKKAAGKKP